MQAHLPRTLTRLAGLAALVLSVLVAGPARAEVMRDRMTACALVGAQHLQPINPGGRQGAQFGHISGRAGLAGPVGTPGGIDRRRQGRQQQLRRLVAQHVDQVVVELARVGVEQALHVGGGRGGRCRLAAQAARLDEEGDEDVLALTRALDLPALVEDELILALPLVPRHEVCPQDVPLEAVDEGFEAAGERPNPFAALAALKKQR